MPGTAYGAFGTLDDSLTGRYYPASGLITLTYNMLEQDSGFSQLSNFYGASELEPDIVTLLTPSSEFGHTGDSVEQKVRAPIFGIVANNTAGALSDQSLGILFTYDILTQSTRNALNNMLITLNSISENALKALLPYLSLKTTKAVGIYWLPISAIVEPGNIGALRIHEITSIT